MFQVTNQQQGANFKPKNGKLRLPKRMFTADEDNTIKQLVRINGEKSWKIISRAFPDRSPRQCRERWKNYLSPTVRNLPWTAEEDNKLADLLDSFGTQWAKIASYFDARTDVNVKNRWSYLKRKEKRLKATSGDTNSNNDMNNNDYNKDDNNNNTNSATSTSPSTSSSSPPQAIASPSYKSSKTDTATTTPTEAPALKSSSNPLALFAGGKKANTSNYFNLNTSSSKMDCSGKCNTNNGRAELEQMAKVVDTDTNNNKLNKSSDQLIDFWDSNWEITDDNNQPCF